jgi:hypothetical protein
MKTRGPEPKIEVLIDTYWTVLNQIAGTPDFKKELIALRQYGDEIRLNVITAQKPGVLARYRTDGLYMGLCGRLDRAAREHSPQLREMIQKRQGRNPYFRMGILISCTIETESTKEESPGRTTRVKGQDRLTANDIRFLHRLGIAADESQAN